MFTIKQVSERLGVSLGIVYREIHAGRLIVHRFGKKTYRVSEENLRDYIKAAKVDLHVPAEEPSRPRRRECGETVMGSFTHLNAERLKKAWSQ